MASLSSRPEIDEGETIRRRLGSPPMLRDPVCCAQPLSERPDRSREGGKNILLRDVNSEKSFLWLWENSPPQLSVCCSNELNKEEIVGYVNKSSFIHNPDSSFVLQEEEQPATNPKPPYNMQQWTQVTGS